MSLTGLVGIASLLAEPARWVFEGVAVTVDPVLAPELKSGWVVSGSFLLDPLEMEEAVMPSGARDGRLTGGMTEGELTLDLYHQVRFEAGQVPGLAGFDYRDNDPEAENRDLLRWFLPLSGEVESGKWSSTWLEVWLFDPEGEMLRAMPPPVPPGGFSWDSSWFRLTFVNSEMEEAFIEGRFVVFAPLDSIDRDYAGEDLSAIIEDLGNRLIKRDRTIADLSLELAKARDRITGLRQMVDLLVEERQRLEEETATLSEKAALADPEIVERLAGLEAEKALLASELENSAMERETIREQLLSVEGQRQKLALEVEELRLSLRHKNRELDSIRTISTGPPSAKPVTGGSEPHASGTPSRQAGMPELRTVPVNRPASPSDREVRRFGPRKFR